MPYRPLPLSDYFIPRRLAEQTVMENALPPQGLLGEVNNPLAPVRSLDPKKQAPLGPWPPRGLPRVGGTLPWQVQAAPPGPLNPIGDMVSALPGLLGGPMTSPMATQGAFPMQDMGGIETPTYPHVQPGEQVGAQGMAQQPGQPPQMGIQPRTDPGFGDRSNAAQGQQQGWMSDAGMWGLLAAGLGILANNSGNYGQASPAIGKGGLIGLQTFLGQRQQAIENQRRNELASADAAWRQSQANYNDRSLGLQERRLSSEEAERKAKADAAAGRQKQFENMAKELPPEDRRLFLADPEGYVRGVMAARKSGGEEIIKESIEGNKIQEWRRNQKTGQLEKWGAPYDRRGEGINVQVDARDTAGIKATIDVDKDRLKEWQAASDAASKGLLPIVRMEKALEGATTYSGAIAPYQKGLANILSGVGIPVDTDRLASSEEYEAQMAQWVRNNIKALGSGTAISNVDLAFTMNSGPAMKNSLPGKKLMLKAMRADMEWIQDAYSSMRKYWDDHNYSLTGWKPPEYKILKELDQSNRPSIDEVMK